MCKRSRVVECICLSSCSWILEARQVTKMPVEFCNQYRRDVICTFCNRYDSDLSSTLNDAHYLANPHVLLVMEDFELVTDECKYWEIFEASINLLRFNVALYAVFQQSVQWFVVLLLIPK